MGALAVGTAVTKFHCECVMNDGSTNFIKVKASNESEASRKVHAGYAVEYVLDVLTPLQMEQRKKHLRRSHMSVVSLH